MNLIILVPVGAAISLLFAFYFTHSIFKIDEGTDKMKDIAGRIRKGANAFLKRQYKGVAIFFLIMFTFLLILLIFTILNLNIIYSFAQFRYTLFPFFWLYLPR